jgi:hypothetical protein
MTQTRFKKIPFDLELAKKITDKEVKGRIVNGDGNEARIICWDKKCDCRKYPIIALVDSSDGEHIHTFTEGGIESIGFKTFKDLHLEVPTYYRDYSNFIPQKWQPCLVRDVDNEFWNVAVCAGKNTEGVVLFYGTGRQKYTCGQVFPLSKITERLVGTRKSYEQLIKELDENEQN